MAKSSLLSFFLMPTLVLAAGVCADPAEPKLIHQFSDEERETLRRDIDRWSTDDTELGARIETRRQALREKAEARFELADTDGDGALNMRELELFNPRLLRHFNRIDANQDGQITKAELAQSFRRRAEHVLRLRVPAGAP